MPITATIESFWSSMGMVTFTGGVNISIAYTKSSLFRSKSNSADEVGRRDNHIPIEDPALAALQWEFLANAGDKLVRVLASAPDGDHRIYAACILAIDSAMGSVQIACVYFVPDVQVLKALTSAARCRRQDHSAKCHRQSFGGPRKALFLRQAE